MATRTYVPFRIGLCLCVCPGVCVCVRVRVRVLPRAGRAIGRGGCCYFCFGGSWGMGRRLFGCLFGCLVTLAVPSQRNVLVLVGAGRELLPVIAGVDHRDLALEHGPWRQHNLALDGNSSSGL